MTLPVISDTFRVSLDWSSSGAISKPATNVMHFKMAGVDDSDVYGIIDGNVAANMWAHAKTSMGVSHVTVQQLDGSDAGSTFATGAPSKWVGTKTSTDAIPAVAAIAKFTTAKRGRSYRGRAYLPWVVESAQANGNLDSTTQSDMQTAWSAFLSACQGDGLVQVIASYKLATVEPVTDILIEALVATQRRRQPR